MELFDKIFGNSKILRFLITIYIIVVIIFLFGSIAPGFFEVFNLSIEKGIAGTPFNVKHILLIVALPILWRLYKDELL